MTFIYKLDPYSFEVYRMHVEVFESYRITYIQTDSRETLLQFTTVYHAASRMVNNTKPVFD